METNCIVVKSGWWASDIAYNACTGTTMNIPWGAADWVSFFAVIGFVLGFSTAFAIYWWPYWMFLTNRMLDRRKRK